MTLTGRRPLTACRHVVSGSLSSPCRGSSHLSLALLGSLSVVREYLALGDGPPGFRPASTCPALLRCQANVFPLRLRDSHPLRSNIPERFGWVLRCRAWSYNPARSSPGGLGWSAFARRYLRSRGFFLFLQVLRCFSSLGSPRDPMHSGHADSGTPASTLV